MNNHPPKVSLRFSQLTSVELRVVAAECSRNREAFATDEWRPLVSCEGPDLFSADVQALPLAIAAQIVRSAGLPGLTS